jgi:hypothetical protein
MRRLTMGAIACFIAVLAPGGTASAVEQYMFEPGGNITKQGAITFSIPPAQAVCNVVLKGAMQAGWIAAGAGGEKIGEITEVTIGGPVPCNAIAWLGIPREMNTQSFLEAEMNERAPNQPAAEALTGHLKTFQIDIVVFDRCLYSGSIRTLSTLMPAAGEPHHHYTVGQLIILDNTMVPLSAGTDCPQQLGVAGAFNTEPEQTLIAR